VHLKGANSMAASGLVFRSELVGTGKAISILFGIKGAISPCRASISRIQGRFSAMTGWHFSRDLTRHLLIGGCGQGHVFAKHG